MGATLHVAPTLEELSRLAAGFVVRSCQSAVNASGRCALALSGGSTPSMLYGLLAHPPYADHMPWGQIHFFWSDERCVPPHDSLSNYHSAEQHMLAVVSVSPENVHRAPVELGGPEAIALAYEQEIQRFFHLDALALPAFDLVLLGVGPDGHIASLFPGSPALEEHARLVAAAMAPEGAAAPQRITFTLPLINHARRVAFLVAGADKRAPLQATLAGDSSLPAGRVSPTQGELYWFVDSAAAGRTE